MILRLSTASSSAPSKPRASGDDPPEDLETVDLAA